MAGTNRGFNAAAFRAGIKFAMDMGAPPSEGERATFYFENQMVYNRPVDDDNVPFDPSSTVTVTPTPPVQVTCAVEYFDSTGQPTNFGLQVPARADVIVLDEEYQQIQDAIYVVLKGEKFVFKSVDYPAGLFDVGIYTLHFLNEDAA